MTFLFCTRCGVYVGAYEPASPRDAVQLFENVRDLLPADHHRRGAGAEDTTQFLPRCHE
jgi:hypothetical protein